MDFLPQGCLVDKSPHLDTYRDWHCRSRGWLFSAAQRGTLLLHPGRRGVPGSPWLVNDCSPVPRFLVSPQAWLPQPAACLPQISDAGHPSRCVSKSSCSPSCVAALLLTDRRWAVTGLGSHCPSLGASSACLVLPSSRCRQWLCCPFKNREFLP